MKWFILIAFFALDIVLIYLIYKKVKIVINKFKRLKGNK